MSSFTSRRRAGLERFADLLKSLGRAIVDLARVLASVLAPLLLSRSAQIGRVARCHRLELVRERSTAGALTSSARSLSRWTAPKARGRTAFVNFDTLLNKGLCNHVCVRGGEDVYAWSRLRARERGGASQLEGRAAGQRRQRGVAHSGLGALDLPGELELRAAARGRGSARARRERGRGGEGRTSALEMVRRLPGAAVSPVMAPLRTSTVWPSDVRVLIHCEREGGTGGGGSARGGKESGGEGEGARSGSTRGPKGVSEGSRRTELQRREPRARERLTSSGMTWMTAMRGSPGSPVRTPSFRSPNHCREEASQSRRRRAARPGGSATHRLDHRVPELLDPASEEDFVRAALKIA